MNPGFGEFGSVNNENTEHPPEYYKKLIQKKNNLLPLLFDQRVIWGGHIIRVRGDVLNTIPKDGHEYFIEVCAKAQIDRKNRLEEERKYNNRPFKQLEIPVMLIGGIGGGLFLARQAILLIEKYKLEKMATTASVIMSIAWVFLIIYIRMQPELEVKILSKEELIKKFFYQNRKEIEAEYKRENKSFEQMKRDYYLE